MTMLREPMLAGGRVLCRQLAILLSSGMGAIARNAPVAQWIERRFPNARIGKRGPQK